MDVDIAATVLAGTILTGLAVIVAVITVVIINNIVHKYWKPIKWLSIQDQPLYSTIEEPSLEVASTSTITKVTAK